MKKECEFGFIEYKKPNPLEGLEFLGKMGVNSALLSNSQELMDNDLFYTAQAIKHMEPFLTKISLKVDKKKIDTYDKVVNSIECMTILMEIAGELMRFMQVDEKKKP